ncbi:DUF3267 domain-containing protein [Rhodococcus aetherivorans]|uniref:DUF3267 domain-containing protein n=1 Tax=Rhodococcus TaxID=1827 RepID=UPI0002D22F27|nr:MULTISPECIES: DUF3267 domain-containing protein [Rhodococcus]ETT27391.1 Protein of unknown function DUF3267 [Rhodococcus rhodochrous ATCC 21198]MDV6296253.1 DUF3267 domain-containing protein [Rhodococcus aetherivorans]OLL16225.1 hypothetical protein BKE56_022670 [Rhodococcus sp. M8]CCW15578.1 hypothetical protein EBESD8_61550 [Rhodococcus aetherivorans]
MNARNDPKPAVAPPPDYRVHTRLDLKNDTRAAAAVRTVLVLTVAVLLGAAVVLGLPLRSGWGTAPTVVVTVVACLGYLAVHELTHGLVSRILSGVRPTYAVRFPFLTTGSDAWLTRNAAVTVTLAPVALWGAVLVALLFAVPADFVLTVFVVTVVNFAGSAGDYVQAGALWRLPASALVQDNGHETTTVVPAGPAGR